jgi:hypothetical protein
MGSVMISEVAKRELKHFVAKDFRCSNTGVKLLASCNNLSDTKAGSDNSFSWPNFEVFGVLLDGLQPHRCMLCIQIRRGF